MSQTTARVAPPSFLTSAVAAGARHLLTGLAGMLMANGIVDKDQSGQVVTIGVSLVTFAVALAWSYAEKHSKIGQITALLGQ